MGLGAVIIDPDDRVLASVSASSSGQSSLTAEYRAALLALEFAQELIPAGQDWILQVDCKTLVDHVLGRTEVRSAQFTLLRDELIACLGSVPLRWVPRERNAAADGAARAGMGVPAGPAQLTLYEVRSRRERRRSPAPVLLPAVS